MDAKSILSADHNNGNGINLQTTECEASLWDFMGTSTYQVFEGISSYYSTERNYDSDVQAAYLAYKDALDKARYWINFFKSSMSESSFTGVINTKYVSPALTGRSGNIEHGDHMFWVKQKIRVSVAEVTRKISYDPEDLKLHETMQTLLPHGPDPYPDPTEVHHRDQIGGIPNYIYYVYSGLVNNGRTAFEKILKLTEKLMRYEVTDVTINDFLTFHNACEEYELFTFSKNHVGVRLTIPDIYQMYEDLKTTEVPDPLHMQLRQN